MEKNEEVKVRKGAWTKEEDALLTKCIQHFGEGRWHLVPPRAGLKRCRKSCRMRWLNYLKPNIKRGCFDTAEVDLIRRLHKLLGNRWSLIAGRIPGRTANDVKNFCNTHMICKKQPSKTVANITTNIIKPRPRSITMSRSQSLQEKNKASSSAPSPPLLQGEVDHECSDQWWRHLLQMSENGHGTQFQDLPAVDNHIDLGGLISDFLKGFHDWESL